MVPGGSESPSPPLVEHHCFGAFGAFSKMALTLFCSLLTLCVKWFARVASLTTNTNSQYLFRIYYVPGIDITLDLYIYIYIFQLYFHLIHKVSHYSHFIDGETKVQ